MDKEKLARLKIEDTALEAIEDALEEKQNDLETRMEAAQSNGNMERKKLLESELAEVEELLEQVKEEIKAASGEKAQQQEKEETVHGAVPTAVDEAAPHTVPVAMGAMDELADKVEGVKKTFGTQKREKEEGAKEKAAAKAQEAEDKKHEAELKAKAEKLRKKAAEEEAERAKAEKEIEKEAEAAGSGAVSGAALSEYEKAFNEGITDYATGKYTDAFQKIYKVANDGENSGLSREKRGQAEWLLSRMYKNGEGTDVNEKRAEYWLKKAAEHENLEGCLTMGQLISEQTPKSPEEENTLRENALKYFEIAGKQGSKIGKQKYIEVCIKKKNQISSANIRTASNFLDELIALEEDSFLRQSLEDTKSELREASFVKKGNGGIGGRFGRCPGGKMYKDFRDVLAIVGALLAMYGVILTCCSISGFPNIVFHFEWMVSKRFYEWPKFFSNNTINDILYVVLEFFGGVDFAEHFAGSFESRNVIVWGISVFIPAGYMLSAISRVEERGKIANVVCEVSMYVSAALGFIAFYYFVNYSYTVANRYRDPGAGDVLFSLSVLAIILVSRIPGMIIRLILILTGKGD